MRTFFTSLLLLLTVAAFAQPAGWHYAIPITVTNTSASPVSGYQLKLYVDTHTPIAATHMLPTGADIRFDTSCVDTGGHLNYWIDSGMNSTMTKIWVKIDTLAPSASRTIYMLYGNDTASAMSTISIFNGPLSSNDSLNGTGANSGGFLTCQRGVAFRPNEDVLVTQFGKNEPTGSTRYITLFDSSTQAIISQLQVSGAAATPSYSVLPTTLWLAKDTAYVLEIHGEAADGYYFYTTTQFNAHLTYETMLYYNGGDQNTFPNTSLPGYQYGFPDMLFYVRTYAASDPTYVLGSEIAFGPVSATITANPGTTIGIGTSVTFTATVSNGGTPLFQWRKNGVNITGATNSTYITNTLQNNDKISVHVKSVGACATPDTAYSDTLTMHVVNGVALLNGGVKDLALYPNPNDGSFVVHGEITVNDVATFAIMNSIGQVVYTGQLTPVKGEINQKVSIDNLADGIYTIQVKQSGQSTNLKFVVQH
jgi:hypothetical protein